MIESNIVKWVDLGDSMQYLDVYGKTKWMKFFNLIKVLIGFKKFSIFFYIVLKCFYFLQIIMLNLTNLSDENDTAIKILKYISTVIFVQDIITDSSTYTIAVILNSGLTLISILCLVYVIISVKIGKFFVKIPISIFNLLNILLLNYFVGPIVQISILATRCTNGNHDYLKVTCYADATHVIFTFVSIFNLLYWIILSIVLSIYFNEIGSINETKVLARVNTNYEIYTNISKISMFIFAYFIKNMQTETNQNTTYRLILQIYMMVNCFGFAIYVYKTVLFYDLRINACILYGWIFVAWFSIVIFLKCLLNINDTSIFHIIGWIIISAIVYILKELKEEYLLTDFNIFEARTLKDIELFNLKLFNLMNMRSIKNKTLLVGIIKKFEELVKTNEEIKEKYQKLFSNEHLRKKFNSNSALSIFSIIYIIYDYHLEKSSLKNDILLTLCYFLMNKLKNVTYAIYLCSKIKAVSHKQMYLKYLLMEEIKAFCINKLSKSNNKESIKHIQLGSAILYNIYIDLFKIKILDSACFQIEYFDLLRNNLTTPKTTENFLKLGEDILNLRKEIMKLWEKIIELNPFNEESYRDYTLYLRDILQDDILLRNESKKYNNTKSSKVSERNNMYNSLFNINSTIILVDGYFSFGKILYTSPNFAFLYNFSGKEVLNMYVDDLCPGVVREFHREVIENAIKYSNLSVIFNKQKDFLLKGKTGNLHNVKVYIKCIPNLSYGLVYMVNIYKVVDNSYIIVLDKDFKISSFTEIFSQGIAYNLGTANNFNSNGYSLDKNIINSYLGVVLPDILLQLEYRDEYGFYLTKDDCDLKGVFYNIAPHRSLNEKVDKVLEQIKLNGKLNFDHEGYQDSTAEFDELTKDIGMKAVSKHSIFYKIITRTFMNKYRYYRVYISNDLITMHEHSSNANNLTGGLSSDPVGKKYVNLKPKIKDNNSREKIFDGNNYTNNLSNNENKRNNSKDYNTPKNPRDISGKQIKIKINAFTSGEENNKLLDLENPDGLNNNNNNNEAGKDNAINKIHNKKHLKKNEGEKGSKENSVSSRTKSALSRSSVDSASFNKLKNGILEKKEVSAIKFMKYLSFGFGIGTILLILFSSQNSNQKFTRLNDYMLQNLYFNHSKITVACVYLATLNLKFTKNNIYQDKRCYNGCTSFYSDNLKRCVTDIKSAKENSTQFFDDFKNILNSQKIISLNLLNFTEKNQIKIDVENNLNLIVAYGLKLNSNIDQYYKLVNSVLDIITENIMEQSLLYIYDQSISGFNDTQKSDNLNKSYLSPINIILIIEGGLFSILIIFFIVFICRLYNLENFYLRKLIQFKNVPFENYLKSLEDIKKRLRNDNDEEEDQFNNDLDMQGLNDNGENSHSKRTSGNRRKKGKNPNEDDDDNDSNEDKKKKDKNDDSVDNKRKNKKKKKNQGKLNEENKKNDNDKKGKLGGNGINSRKNKNKKSTRNYQEEKINIMGKYFLKWNMFFCIKVISILLLSASYYLVVSIIDQSTMNNMLNFDYTTNSIEGVYKESFMIYLSLKTQLAKYIDFELAKRQAALSFYIDGSNATQIRQNATVMFKDFYYTTPQALLSSSFYKMDIPYQIDTPKIGTLLMPIISTDLSSASSTIVSLNNLYNVDACSELFIKYSNASSSGVSGSSYSLDYSECSKFWSSILLKGMEQSITQMSVVITSVLDDLNSLNQNSKSIAQILQDNSVYSTYEQFVELYLFDSYMKTKQIFKELNAANLDVIYATYQSIMIGYICFVIILFGFLLYFVYKSKFIFNTFMNFIGILPVKYLLEDPTLYKEILKLEQYIYY